jgi:hypothetical protein
LIEEDLAHWGGGGAVEPKQTNKSIYRKANNELCVCFVVVDDVDDKNNRH